MKDGSRNILTIVFTGEIEGGIDDIVEVKDERSGCGEKGYIASDIFNECPDYSGRRGLWS